MKVHFVVLIFGLLLLTTRLSGQVSGCTDSLALNFNPAATVNDGSCIYESASISPEASYTLSSELSETSGLVLWNNLLWTHNDDSDTKLYCLDTLNGSILQTVTLTDVVNTDWEELSQDEQYIYVGDFGNNLNGNRTDLKILKISKTSILAGNAVIDTISFSYSDQVDFSPTGANNTDFDCEAMIVSTDSIYLFTKQWVSKETKVYSLPKATGIHVAFPVAANDVNGLITGATYIEQMKLVILSGYSSLLSPFVWLLYDFDGHRFFSGNKRRVGISLPFHQVEAIATANGNKVYMTNENFVQPPIINSPQALHIFDFSPFLSGYLNNLLMNITTTPGQLEVFIYPNPATEFVSLRVADSLAGMDFSVLDAFGRSQAKGQLNGNKALIDLSGIRGGIYLLRIGKSYGNSLKLIIR